ncbi:MAG: hypothetical protein K2W95_36090 [Candidatus Obscuribacterales bacterium]|nr:hypothetical protein [Candidatus Obscuribacterales bacterium]
MKTKRSAWTSPEKLFEEASNLPFEKDEQLVHKSGILFLWATHLNKLGVDYPRQLNLIDQSIRILNQAAKKNPSLAESSRYYESFSLLHSVPEEFRRPDKLGTLAKDFMDAAALFKDLRKQLTCILYAAYIQAAYDKALARTTLVSAIRKAEAAKLWPVHKTLVFAMQDLALPESKTKLIDWLRKVDGQLPDKANSLLQAEVTFRIAKLLSEEKDYTAAKEYCHRSLDALKGLPSNSPDQAAKGFILVGIGAQVVQMPDTILLDECLSVGKTLDYDKMPKEQAKSIQQGFEVLRNARSKLDRPEI